MGTLVKTNNKWQDAFQHNSIYWYVNPGKACGFSAHKKVVLWYADAAEELGKSYKTVNAEGSDKERLSWNLDKTSTGGYRAGKKYNLGSSTEWEKVMYVSNCI